MYAVGAEYRKHFYLTDGRGRHIAFTNSLGTNYMDDPTYYQNGGNQAGSVENSHGFDNARQASANMPQLSFYRNRYYDQRTGRFLQEDPIDIAGGVNLYQFAGNNPVAYTDPFGLCPEDVGGDGKTETVRDCPDDVKGAWAEKHIVVNPNTNWEGVDAGLRDAVLLASMELRKTFYVSAGKEAGHAPTAHEEGRGVDVSRINGTRFADMNATTARMLGNQVGATIANFLPYGRGMEVYTPGMAFRFDRFLSQESRNSLMASHWHHVHVTLRP